MSTETARVRAVQTRPTPLGGRASAVTSHYNQMQQIEYTDSGQERIKKRVHNIQYLCDASRIAIELLGQQLSQCKWNFEYLLDPRWTEEDISKRGWSRWLSEVAKFVYTGGEKDVKITDQNAPAFIAYSACCQSIRDENTIRANQNKPPLPEPTSPVQIEPYQGFLDRVDTWNHANALHELGISHDQVSLVSITRIEGPYAEEQVRFVREWADAWDQLPVEKKINKDNLPVPPERNISRKHIKEKYRQQSEDITPHTEEDLKQEVVNINAKAAKPKQPKPQDNQRPITQQELDDMAREQRERDVAIRYRQKILDTMSAAEGLQGYVVQVISDIGYDKFKEICDRDYGAWSVDNHLGLIQDIINLLVNTQGISAGMVPISQGRTSTDDASEQVVEVSAS